MEHIGSIFADGIRSKWVPGLNNIVTPKSEGVSSWLAKGDYIWLPSSSDQVMLDVGRLYSGLADAFASEISRFSCAAYESLLDAVPPPERSRSLAWALVRHYYAIFYCAHALLRIAGISLTYMSSETAHILNEIGGQYLGVSPQLKSGLWLLRRETGMEGIVSLRKVSHGSGGSHEDMWTQFLKLLVEIENSIILSQGQLPIAQSAVDISKSLRKQLCKQGKGNGSWPSTFRNAVNYKHDYGIWYPYNRAERDCTTLTTRMRRWVPDNPSGFAIDTSRDELVNFADICNVIAQLLTASLRDISKRSPGVRQSFVDRQPFKFLRHWQISV